MASIAPRRDKAAGRLLREWRIDKGLSPEALSWELRRHKLETVSGKQIRRIEAEGIVPTPRVMFALASYFDARPSEVWRSSLKVAA